ncbi:phospholipid scramblase 2-like [Choloepus didactylus]|uniref:phospholipid scramblase 2-like n=1 Tax=Choloepus didactylus TaxID=27675 RepID=UPI00189FE342|nr:phospholipid scramblase 2-like [Choloepus didactylus]
MNVPHSETTFPEPLGHNGHPDAQAVHPDCKTDHPVPLDSHLDVCPADFPVHQQPVYNHTDEPEGVQWIPTKPSPSICPPGLEYLIQIDQIVIEQQLEILEVVTVFEANNKYEIKDILGQRIYFAAEKTDCRIRNILRSFRPFNIMILDNKGLEVINLKRQLRCKSCCFPCCLQELEIYAPPDVPIGYIIQTWHPCLPKFTVQNEKREDVLKITGSCCGNSCFADTDFEIKSLDEKVVIGKISKRWTGILRAVCADIDNFEIQFPLDLDVKMKAVMLGACFLIDFMFYER